MAVAATVICATWFIGFCWYAWDDIRHACREAERAGVGVSVPPVVGEADTADAGVFDWETA